MDISEAVLRLEPRLVETRRDLHRHPEPGFQEHRTSGIVAARLQELGLTVKTGVAGTGVIGVLGAANPGEALLLRFDMDALPIDERTSASYSSTNPGWMHACGHDGHTSIGLATAEALAADPPPGPVKFLFQPAEEGPGGALPMIEAGALQDPPVSHCLALHLWNQMPVGTIGVRTGATMAAVSTFDIEVLGRGGHGAAPQQAADALVAAAHLVVELQTIVSRSVDPLSPAVLTVGAFHAGAAYNVIAEEAKLMGTFRAFDEETREIMGRRLTEICDAAAAGSGVKVDLSLVNGYPPVVNDAGMAALVRDAAGLVVGADRITDQTLWMAGEDMSYFLRERPGCLFFVGSANESRGLTEPHHSPRFDFDEQALLVGTETMVRSVRRFFEL